MDDNLETYELETIEQLRAIADELRVRIVKQLAHQAMTVTQLAELLGEAPNKLHYHVRELERVGLVKKVETREKGAILEKYYRAVAKHIITPPNLLSGMAPNEAAAVLNELAQSFFQAFTRAAGQAMRAPAEDERNQTVLFASSYYWLTSEELDQVNEQIQALLRPYKKQRGVKDENEQAIAWLAYPTTLAGTQEEAVTPPALPEAAAPSALSSTRSSRRKLVVQIGTSRYTRWDLEAFLAQGEAKNMYVFGTCTFDEDIPPDLVERAIASFHIKGKLNASPEVREVLKHKEGETNRKNT